MYTTVSVKNASPNRLYFSHSFYSEVSETSINHGNWKKKNNVQNKLKAKTEIKRIPITNVFL